MINKSYYAVIPATVRYDDELPAAAKLLYAEITALCNERGYSWASNKYFADLYKVSHKSVQRWIAILTEKKYITLDIRGARRKIYLCDELPSRTKMSGYPDKNVRLTRTKMSGDPSFYQYINNIINNIININDENSIKILKQIIKENLFREIWDSKASKYDIQTIWDIIIKYDFVSVETAFKEASKSDAKNTRYVIKAAADIYKKNKNRIMENSAQKNIDDNKKLKENIKKIEKQIHEKGWLTDILKDMN